jgi:hypothetical protein
MGARQEVLHVDILFKKIYIRLPHSTEPPLPRLAQAAMAVSSSICWDDQLSCALCCVACGCDLIGPYKSSFSQDLTKT